MTTVITITKSMVRKTKAFAEFLAYIALPLGFPLATFVTMRMSYFGY